MKILVIGGMHGNEPLGQALVELLAKRKLQGVDYLLANERAIDEGCRFTEQDLNRSFPGNSDSGVYEERRAAYVLERCLNYDIVFDFHNTNCANNDCSFVGEAASQILYDVSKFVGLNRVIVADYDCLNKYAPNCISIEISLTSDRMGLSFWLEKISELIAIEKLPIARSIETYRFVYRMTLEDKAKLNLDKLNLKAFVPIDPSLASKMGVGSPAYPIFIDDAYTPYNYGGLLNKKYVN